MLWVWIAIIGNYFTNLSRLIIAPYVFCQIDTKLWNNITHATSKCHVTIYHFSYMEVWNMSNKNISTQLEGFVHWLTWSFLHVIIMDVPQQKGDLRTTFNTLPPGKFQWFGPMNQPFPVGAIWAYLSGVTQPSGFTWQTPVDGSEIRL